MYPRTLFDIARWVKPEGDMLQKMEKRINADAAEKERRQQRRLRELKEKEEARAAHDEQSHDLSRAASKKVSVWGNGKGVEGLLRTLHIIVPGVVPKAFELPTGCDPSQVKKVYRRAVRLVHPDKLDQLSADVSMEDRAAASKVFTCLNEAWDVYRRRNSDRL
jgi:hypothetical protein